MHPKPAQNPWDIPVASSFKTAGIASMLGALCAFCAFCAFLLLNCRFFQLKQAIVFLGDPGCATIGFFVVYLLIDFSQGSNSFNKPGNCWLDSQFTFAGRQRRDR